jgi:hypothetical protein
LNLDNPVVMHSHYGADAMGLNPLLPRYNYSSIN